VKLDVKFGAAAAAAGYYYQARLALFEALKFAYADSGIEIAVERLDDVSFECNGTPLELLQTKHHFSKIAELTDYCADLWKTIRIWSERIKLDPTLASRTRFALITTGVAPKGSAASLLRVQTGTTNRDPDTATARLVSSAEASNNAALQSAFNAFLSLAPEMRKSLVSAIDVLDRSPSLVDLQPLIEDRLKMIAPRGKQQLAREYLEGWWWGRICKALQEPSVGSVSVLEVEAKLDDIRDVMKRDALPVEMEDANPREGELEAFDEMTFVRQLRLIRLGAARIEFAKRDFYRASTQRSRWTRENLLFDGEVSTFETRLVEEWQPRFHAMCEDLAPDAEDFAIHKAGQILYRWVETEARLPFRSVLRRFLSVGSYHILSNDVRVGWHRDFGKTFSSSEEDAHGPS
jgi:hypothetical protein